MAKSFVSKPTYPGGNRALNKFVRENLTYPAQARDAGIEGTVNVRYSVDYRGKVVDTQIKKSLGYGCDEEAARVVGLLQFTVPQDRKKKVRIHQDIKINFRLPKEKKKTTTKITYTVSSAGPRVQGEEKSSGGGYGYTISW